MTRRRPSPTPSLRAKRSNPEISPRDSLDCFVARAPRNDGERFCHLLRHRADDANTAILPPNPSHFNDRLEGIFAPHSAG
ncbi:hypothetical protein C7U92_06065 [Bradyrhizobium sp. WBOS7]|uniref:Uncharacterized protein n=1 Tax=Bradyrhizobium betae TaxID=244734 RepID=A0AAE9NF47_9BRAD|nr:hypothetical protein [Bradyrhizobium sp. WBOS2]MDD1569183.1 hypothetical protein [Bradyrhizobium sp. WBOS1]MDD1576302.1 hypothetical protein [Bradyrhizobium sp. WBOS7]MDD1602556.1 hypothetical protein [Bradyrhizobium sp. WBOS16]UUO37986.1 hypothetical protein DCK84_27675 [Bradyrhizobium sp. WBOS01]UUO44152.1 hypothetical protein DCM75_27645 [Bradyrhizobium sp. WBOS02]UUO54559.1 hypothetical protein DCM79_17240 [Bradyrhizobium sp. WBOS07]UUO68560.1 hypothetical protein DCM83_27350 [Bradyrh